MGAINTQKREYFTIGGGKLNKGRGDARQTYDTVFGTFIGLHVRKANVSGEEKTFVDFNFQDGSEFFCVSSELYKNNTNQIIRSLVNIPDYQAGHVYISAWATTKDGRTYTNIAVRFKKPTDSQPQRLDWAELPKEELVTIPQTGEVIKSTRKLRDAVDRYIQQIQDRFAAPQAPEDLPADGDPDIQQQSDFMPNPAQGAAPGYGYIPQPQPGQGYGPQGAAPGYGYAPQPQPGQGYGPQNGPQY